MKPIADLAAALASGETSATELVEESLAAISSGEGPRAFLSVDAAAARKTAADIDGRRRSGTPVGTYAGIPLGVKDLFDIEGQVTTAGSVVLQGQAPARSDAPAVAAMKRAGFVVMGRTHMTEFAYSGLGLNSHFETPRIAWDRESGHIPGGSSSGSAVAVADGMVPVALGTDTGGSCRIPAAFNGIVGYKPTARRVDTSGVFPLAPSLDSVGPLARKVHCCAIVDDILAGGDGSVAISQRAASDIRLAVIVDYVLEGLDPVVSATFNRAIDVLIDAGMSIERIDFPELVELPTVNPQGGLARYEALEVHRVLLAEHGDGYDQRVRGRLEDGPELTEDQRDTMLAGRQQLISAAATRLTGFDAFVLPAVAVAPPTIDSFADGDLDYYTGVNGLCLRNTFVGNFLDACAITVPASAATDAPVGLMLMAGAMADHHLLSVASVVERHVGQVGNG